LRTAAPGLEGEWLAAVSRLPIEACESHFKFRCPKRWENLRATDDPKVRDCGAWGESVQFSETIAEARGQPRQGRCVALSLEVSRCPGDLTESGRRFTREELMALGGRRHPLGRITTIEIPAAQPQPPITEPEPERQTDPIPRQRLRRQRRRKRWTMDAD